MKTCVLRDWAVVGSDNPYTAPELRYLTGKVFGHPKFWEGEPVTTSHICDADGRVVTTRNTIYILDGPPEPGYVEYCLKNSILLDLDNPIRVKRLN